MRVGLIAPPWACVPPRSYGGTEGVVDTLARGLRDAGHDVVLYATGDSTCPVERRWTYPTPAEPMGLTPLELRHVQSAYAALEGCDVIHDHTTVGPVWAQARGDLPPIVTTVHCVFSTEARALYADLARWGVTVNAISQDQRDSAPEVPVAAVIHHGLDTERFELGAGDGGYALFLGRCAPEKGMHEAIEIARRGGLRLRLAAKMRAPDEQRYFERFIEPHLGPDVESIGEIGPAERVRELAGASVLLNPIAWREPFGLVMIEALACGTPVLSYPAGAAPEIVAHGTTGFLCRDVDEAVSVLPDVPALDRGACRRSVEERFSARRMTDDYVRLYRAAIRGRRTADDGDPRPSLASPTERRTTAAIRSGVVDVRRRRENLFTAPS
jgi:glycosyltransferase involved in cell wall biosynthesis